MNTVELFAKIRADIQEAGKPPVTQIPIANLLQYVALLEQSVKARDEENEHAVEQSRLRVQQWVAQLQFQSASSVEMFKAVLESGREGIRAFMIMNGAAAIAVLGFLANLAASDSPDRHGMATSLLVYAIGVFLAAAAYASRYFSQHAYAGAQRAYLAPDAARGNWYESWGDRWRYTAIATALLSGLTFLGGCVLCYVTLRG